MYIRDGWATSKHQSLSKHDISFIKNSKMKLGCTWVFAVVLMMAIMYNSVQAAPFADADADADAEALALAGFKDWIKTGWGWLKKHGPEMIKAGLRKGLEKK